MLTGKAKEDFKNWLEIQEIAPYYAMFDSTPEFIQISYIAEWLDSVGYKICVEPILGGAGGFRIFVLHKNFHDWIDERHDNRTAANKSIIQKSNTLYNERNT